MAHLLRLIALGALLFSGACYADVNHYYETQAEALAGCQYGRPAGGYTHMDCVQSTDDKVNPANGLHYYNDYIAHMLGGEFHIYYWRLTPPPRTAAQCAADNSSISQPVPGATPASLCFNGCTYSDDGLGPYCDMLGGNCSAHYTTAGAAANLALSPGDGRFSATCTTGTTPGATAADSDGDGIPNSSDPDSKDTDGDGTPDSKDPYPTDATNGKGTTDGKSENTSVGGADCSSPPISHGDGIATQVAYQTWSTRCAVERLNALTVKGQKAGTSGLSATDSQKLSNTALNTGATAAAAGSIDGKLTDTGTGAATVSGVEADAGRGSHGAETTYGASGLDTSGMGAGNTCPTMGTLNILGRSITPDTSLMCTWARVMGQLVLVFAALGCLRILGSAA